LHTIEGVVVGDYQDTEVELGGFFLQEEDVDADAFSMTSEGIFVYESGTEVHAGDIVRVTGTVAEYLGLTELTSVGTVTLCSAGNSVTAATVTLPISDMAEWEWVEGMLMNIPHELYVTDNYDLGRYGQMQLSVNDRLYNPTSVVSPGTDANDLQDLNDRSRVVLDDANNSPDPDPIIYPSPELSATNTLRSGDTVPDLTGVVHDTNGDYRMQPVGPIAFTAANGRPAIHESVGGRLKVASFNVLNFFTTLDTGAPVCGPTGGMDCRGAETAAEFSRQRDKIINAIIAMDADVIGLMEIENHPTDAALQDLVDGLNAAAGAGTYARIATGTIGTDAIKVAFIYRPGTITPVGTAATIDIYPFDDLNRPPLAQTFEENATEGRFTAVVNHLKSKECSGATGDNADQGDGQGCWNAIRTEAAAALVAWLATDPTSSGDPDFIIIGDLNSYAMEDPIATLKADGYANLFSTFVGPDAYSYIYDGQSGYLDHALSNDSLTPQVTGATIWHINADEPSVLDYNTNFKSLRHLTTLYSDDPYRASDHDPLIVGLSLLRPADLTPSVKSVEPNGAVDSGSYLTYTVVLSNSGDFDSWTVVTDSLPAELGLVTGFDSNGLTWSGVVTAGQQVELALLVQTDPTLAANTVVSNAVTIADGFHLPFDVYSPETVILVPDLTIAKDVAPTAGVLLDSVVVYTITLGNSGDGTAADVEMIDILPSEVNFGGWIAQPPGAVEVNGTITWTGDVASMMDVVLVFSATVGSEDGYLWQTVENIADLYSGNAGSGSAGAAFTVGGTPDFDASKSSTNSNQQVMPGDLVTYTITLSNTGGANATVLVTDVLGVYYSVYDALDTAESPTGTLTWSGTVTAGQEVALQYVVRVVGLTELPTGLTVLQNTVKVDDGVHTPFTLLDPSPPWINVSRLYLPLTMR
jgi:uncharacterized repeat protein (TIGR01451 family)